MTGWPVATAAAMPCRMSRRLRLRRSNSSSICPSMTPRAACSAWTSTSSAVLRPTVPAESIVITETAPDCAAVLAAMSPMRTELPPPPRVHLVRCRGGRALPDRRRPGVSRVRKPSDSGREVLGGLGTDSDGGGAERDCIAIVAERRRRGPARDRLPAECGRRQARSDRFRPESDAILARGGGDIANRDGAAAPRLGELSDRDRASSRACGRRVASDRTGSGARCRRREGRGRDAWRDRGGDRRAARRHSSSGRRKGGHRAAGRHRVHPVPEGRRPGVRRRQARRTNARADRPSDGAAGRRGAAARPRRPAASRPPSTTAAWAWWIGCGRAGPSVQRLVAGS